jgi:hypothetical protein
MKKLLCFLQDFEAFGIFVGCSLLESQGNYQKRLKSIEFYNEVSEKLEDFLKFNEYTCENMEKWFNRFVRRVGVEAYRSQVV